MTSKLFINTTPASQDYEIIQVSDSPLYTARNFKLDDFNFDMTLPIMHEDSYLAQFEEEKKSDEKGKFSALDELPPLMSEIPKDLVKVKRCSRESVDEKPPSVVREKSSKTKD